MTVENGHDSQMTDKLKTWLIERRHAKSYGNGTNLAAEVLARCRNDLDTGSAALLSNATYTSASQKSHHENNDDDDDSDDNSQTLINVYERS